MKQKIADFLNVIFGFRKFILLLILYSVGVIFRCKDLINGSELVDLFKTTTVAFIGANSVEHVVSAAKAYMDSKTAGDDPKTSYEDIVSPSDQEAEDAKAEAKAGS